jgi:hypothetical protein
VKEWSKSYEVVAEVQVVEPEDGGDRPGILERLRRRSDDEDGSDADG